MKSKVTHLKRLLCGLGLLCLASQSMAAGFQLFEQDGGSLGNYHAGYAAAADDASTAFYNPAGLTRFKNQQLVVGGVGIVTSAKYTGTIGVNTINAGAPRGVVAQGGVFKVLPGLHYAAPISDKLVFGFSVDVPFGLATDYGKSTILRYAATESSVKVIDFSPVLAYQVTKQLSFGVGPDIQYMKGEFNQVGTLGGDELDSDGLNSADGTAYGYHAGVLYEFNEDTRVGLSYHSQVVHHLTGTSRFEGPLADALGGPFETSRSKLNITLPPYTALSVYHKMNPKIAVMGSVIYTQWNTIQQLVLQNVAGVDGLEGKTDIVADLPEKFRNTYNISIGANYFATDKITLRGGIGFDQSPVSDAYRNVRLPDKNRYVIALGGRYQATKAVAVDLGWTHLFINKAHVIPPTQATGDEEVTLNGSVRGGADVFGAQVVWDIL